MEIEHYRQIRLYSEPRRKNTKLVFLQENKRNGFFPMHKIIFYGNDKRRIMEEHNNLKQKITQESLQPQQIKPEDKAYQSVLDIEERLQKGDATNIALTGPYGSGKSSILISLKKDFPNHNYLNISLATLKPSDTIIQEKAFESGESKKDEPSKLNLDRLIEYSILQQLIYKEKQDALPNSRFKRVFHMPKDQIVKVTVAVILTVIALIVVLEPTFLRVEWLCKLLGKEWMNVLGDVVSMGYLLWFAYHAIALIVPAISNSRLNKLNLKDGEIEIVENTSIFNKHLDEILYFFEQTKYDVVLLEDLDRFESTDIFLKLRELNLLLNESKVVGRKVFFIYAVRDDMFQDAERVKCFDYITTVIPVINRSNAKSQLKEELEKRGVTEIKESTLKELGFFLHDMRLLKNIANEFVQYRGKLEKRISSDKLLAMIVYKNYYPQDFAKLHDCKGVVYELLNLKEILVSTKITNLQTEYKKQRELQERHQKERHLKEVELRRIYLEAYRERLGNTMLQLKIGDVTYEIKDVAANEKLFEKLIEDNHVTYTYIGTNGSYYNRQPQKTTIIINFSDVETSVDPELTYHERLKALRSTFDEHDYPEFIDIRKEDIRSQSLSQLLSSIDYQTQEEYKQLTVPRLIEYLMVKGYIDENYYDYISYFYDNFIDAHDWDFILDLKLGKVHPFDYHIDNVEACLTEIPNTIYRTKAILNINLIDYLAEHQTDQKNQMRLLTILRTAVEEKKFDFLANYYLMGKQQDIVFSQLFGKYKNLWSVFEKYDDKKMSLKLCWYRYAEKEQSFEDSKNWLSKHFGFITDHLLDISDEHWAQLINKGDYQFEELNKKSDVILKTVLSTDSYTITKHNVEVLVSYLLDTSIDSVSYRLVVETEHDGLVGEVEDNLGQCLKTVFSSPESEKENVETIYGILLSPKVTDDEKISYLKKQQNKIVFEVIEQNDVKTLALRCDVIEPTWMNVIHYMNNVSEKKMDEALTAFIERHADELAELTLPSEAKEHEKMLLSQLNATDILSYEAFVKILERFTKWHYSGGVPSIEDRRIRLMITKGMVNFTTENTDSLMSGYSVGTIVAYLMHHKRQFLQVSDTVEYSTELAIELMKTSLSMREKAIIIPNFKKEILNQKLANEVIHILMTQEIKMDLGLLLKAMSLSNNTNDKIIVLNYTLEQNTFDEGTTTALLKTMPGKYKEIAEKGKKPEIPNNEHTLKLVKTLKEKAYISSYSESKKGIRVNTKLK